MEELPYLQQRYGAKLVPGGDAGAFTLSLSVSDPDVPSSIGMLSISGRMVPSPPTLQIDAAHGLGPSVLAALNIVLAHRCAGSGSVKATVRWLDGHFSAILDEVAKVQAEAFKSSKKSGGDAEAAPAAAVEPPPAPEAAAPAAAALEAATPRPRLAPVPASAGHPALAAGAPEPAAASTVSPLDAAFSVPWTYAEQAALELAVTRVFAPGSGRALTDVTGWVQVAQAVTAAGRLSLVGTLAPAALDGLPFTPKTAEACLARYLLCRRAVKAWLATSFSKELAAERAGVSLAALTEAEEEAREARRARSRSRSRPRVRQDEVDYSTWRYGQDEDDEEEEDEEGYYYGEEDEEDEEEEGGEEEEAASSGGGEGAPRAGRGPLPPPSAADTEAPDALPTTSSKASSHRVKFTFDYSSDAPDAASTGYGYEFDSAAPRALAGVDLAPAHRGTALRAAPLSLFGIGSLAAAQVSVTLQCDRCSTLVDVDLRGARSAEDDSDDEAEGSGSASGGSGGSGSGGASNGTSDKQPQFKQWCPKCSLLISASLRPTLAHAGSGLLGYVDPEHATVANVRHAALLLVCLECGQPSETGPLAPPVAHERACRTCHARLRLEWRGLETAVASRDAPAEPAWDHAAAARKAAQLRFPAGRPLPREGTCAHYGSSHRWFRFPCCAKAFACDVCHDATSDHPHEWATRMICGFCSREQPFANGPCVSCGKQLGRRARASSRHWEGGAGQRNKARMDRRDAHKYTGLAKTKSRKCVKTPKASH